MTIIIIIIIIIITAIINNKVITVFQYNSWTAVIIFLVNKL